MAVAVAALGVAAVALMDRDARALTNCDVDPAQIALNANEQTFLQLLNEYRAQHGAPGLVASTPLNRAAAWLAIDMATKGYFDHVDSLGRGPQQRFPQCGYPYGGSENILYGRATALGALNLWKTSPGHNANMLSGQWRVIGIGYYNGFWVTTFGTTVYGVDETPQAPPTALPTATPTPTPTPTPSPTPPGVSVPGLGSE